MASILDKHGSQWHDWILSNLQRQCTPGSLFANMVQSVWSSDDAAQALNQGLTALGLPQSWQVALPDIRLSAEKSTVQGQAIRMLGQFKRPRAVLLDNVLHQTECEAVIEYAMQKGLKHSGVVDQETGYSVQHQARTSTSVEFTRAETPLIDTIERRLATLTDWPIDNGEGLQVLRYAPGQQYKPHFDWFDPQHPGSARHLQRGGQRVATTVIYLATAEEGGGTCFPKVGLEVSPRTGGAIFFHSTDMTGQPDAMSLHAGTPVVQGTKIVMTYWQRERPFV